MKTTFQRMGVAILLSMAIVTSSCANSLTQERKKEERDVKNFTAIQLSISADVYLTQANGYSFTIEGDKSSLDRVITEVRGNTLVIKTERINQRFLKSNIKIHITMPDIEGLAISGSGDIKAVTPLVTRDLTLRVSGSGDISIPDLTLKSLYAAVSGSGDITISGQGVASDANVKISGSGDVILKGVRFQNADISIAGSGDAYVELSENLKARVAGSGDIVYSGNPLVDAKVSGSGTIRNK
ncbi:MAG TPA: DUF2807 domain-containing protein [Bacteroidales bacterium]|jgi:hypothetical protein|nr:DUF2807 domain-containing protein [Bacteroidales bacterium]